MLNGKFSSLAVVALNIDPCCFIFPRGAIFAYSVDAWGVLERACQALVACRVDAFLSLELPGLTVCAFSAPCFRLVLAGSAVSAIVSRPCLTCSATA